MLDGGVARDEIHEDAQAALVAGRDQLVQGIECPVLGRDIGVVADVVAEVVLRARVHRRQPDGVDAEGGIGASQVLQPLADAVEIADAVAVRVGEAARIDLVDDRPVPPAVVGGARHEPRFY